MGMVSGDSREGSVEVVVVVPSVVAAVVVVGVRIVGLWGTALPAVAFVLSVSGAGFGFSGWTFACWAWKGSIFL